MNNTQNNIDSYSINENDLNFSEYDNTLDSTIETYCREWVEKYIGKDFQFREHQLECIIRIILNIVNHKYQNYIIEAPTGSGKSLINIISAGVLAEYFDITSYILVSDLFLWEQYNQFLKKHKKTGIAIIKGQTGNYTCKLNGEDIRNSDCRMSDISWYSLFNPRNAIELGYDCALSCEYVRARKKAVNAKVCIMTYQLFLYIMNNPQFNKRPDGNPIFAVHDCLFCDECHNIPEIIQLEHSPNIKIEDFEKLHILYNQSCDLNLGLFNELNINTDGVDLYKRYPTWNDLYKELKSLWKIWICEESRKDEDYASANKYLEIFRLYITVVESIKSRIITKKLNKEHLSKDDITLFKLCTWHENNHCNWTDFCKAIEITGVEYFLKDINILEKNNIKDEDIIVNFKCTKEDYITWFFFLQRAQHKIMVSATVGTKEAFDERMGFHYEQPTAWNHPNAIINESYMEVIPHTFDYSQSPVFFLNKFKMTFKEREISFRHLKNVIYSICKTKFKNQKGMIQTGSYEFAKRLYNDAPDDIKERMLLYNGNREKRTCVEIHMLSPDTILVGPTLNTGIDLPGDHCRFIIILKVPYPTLIDKLVHERNRLYPLWYNSHTSNEIIQGIGRGVRYNGDWCVTYILDASFHMLYQSTKKQYPEELQKRIQYV